MADSGFDSGPPSKKSKTSSPTSSITSFDHETAGKSMIQHCRALSPMYLVFLVRCLVHITCLLASGKLCIWQVVRRAHTKHLERT